MDMFLSSIGWVGTGLIVIAYLLNSNNKISSNSKWYQIINLFGAIFVGVNVFTQQAWPAFTLQVIWGVIAIIALIKIQWKKK